MSLSSSNLRNGHSCRRTDDKANRLNMAAEGSGVEQRVRLSIKKRV